MSRKVVLLLGAGASVADVATRPAITRPPLDKRFFSLSSRTNPAGVEVVRRYMAEIYNLDVLERSHDSLEGVMGLLYPDLFNPALEGKAVAAFRSLLQVFNKRLASTTNDIAPTQKRFLYRMLSRLLTVGVKPDDITVITFNQDLQVEKTLEMLAAAARWKSIAKDLFCFPYMYGVERWSEITEPTSGSPDVFVRADRDRPGCLRVLKLHGSLNWYSTHISKTPSPSAMFNASRALRVTQRRSINPDMTLNGRTRKRYTLPVVVPPVNHKSAVLHERMRNLWAMAEERLSAADELVIFGYSCPALDFESSNLLRRAQPRRPPGARTAVVDPDGGVVARYVTLLQPSWLEYFPGARAYLAPR